MKHKSRFLLPILTFLTFGMITGSIVTADYIKEDAQAAEASSATAGDILYFIKPSDWSTNVRAHIYKNSTGTPEQAWPGRTMTDTGKDFKFGNTTYDIYSVSVNNTGSDKVIFSDNGDSNKRYPADGRGGIDLPAHSSEYRLYDIKQHYWTSFDNSYDPKNLGTRTVYVRRPTSWDDKWSTIKIYGWVLDCNNGWRGPNMAYVGLWNNYRYYCYRLDAQYFNFIFSGYNGDTYKAETGNLSLPMKDSHNCYNMEDGTWGTFNFDYKLGSGSWTTTGDEDYSDYAGKYYSPTAVQQNAGDELHLRFTWNGTSLGEIANAKMSLWSGSGANNFGKATSSTRPSIRFNHDLANKYLNFYVQKGQDSPTIYVYAEGLYHSGYFDFILDNNYYWTYHHNADDYWFRGKSPDEEGITITSGQVVSILRSDTGDNYKPTYLHMEEDDSDVFTLTGSDTGAICQKTGKYEIRIEKDTSPQKNVNVLYPIRRTRIVSYVMNGHGSQIPTEYYLTYNTKVSEPTDPTATGYTFGGWYSDSGLTTPWNFSSNVTEDLTLYAKWTAKTYGLTLNRNGGTTGSTGVTATYNAAMPSATMPTRTGYRFTGYTYLGNSTKYYNADGTSAHVWDVDSAVTLTAGWNVNTYTIGYNLGGGESGGHQPTSGTYDDVFYVSAPTRTAYTFAGWIVSSGLNSSTAKWGTTDNPTTAIESASDVCFNGIGGNVYFKNITPTNNASITLTATWTPITYSISYSSDYTHSNPTSYNIETPTITLEDPTRTGYTFDGWTGSNGNTPQKNPLVTIPLGSYDNKSYTGHWTANTYGILYNANKPVGATGEVTNMPADDTWTYDQNGTLGSAPSLINYYFDGWYKEAGCSNKAGDAGQTLTKPNFSTGADVNLYAKWTEIDIDHAFIISNKFGVQYKIPKNDTYNALYDTVQITSPKPQYTYVDYETKTYTPTPEGDYKIVNLAVNSSHLTADITFNLLKGGNIIYTETLSLSDMTASIAGSGSYSTDSKDVKALKSSLTYATYSQLYFGVGTSDLANKDISAADKTAILNAMNSTDIPTSSIASPTIVGTPNISITGIAFGSSDGFTLRFKLNFTGDISNYEAVLNDAPSGVTIKIAYDEPRGHYYAYVSGISASNLRTALSITLRNKTTSGTYTFSASVGTYCSIVDRTESIKSDTGLYNLCKAVNLLAEIEA